MDYREPIADVGVIVGRFQVAELHEGHRALIQDVIDRHKKVIVLLGVAPLPNSINNPLDFESRKQMLAAAYPNLTVLYVKDVNDDLRWSQAVDSIVTDVLSPTQTALLYGSRDSFITSYMGRFNTFELPTEHDRSGTAIRAELGREARNSPEWRAGVIWASRNRFPTSYACVDVAIFNRDYSQLLLGQKAHEPGWRLIGGFADPGSVSLEADAERETREEAGSFRIDDWRYRNEPDCIKTSLFTGWTIEDPVAGDDIARVAWFDLPELQPNDQRQVMPLHRKLVTHALMHTAARRLSWTQTEGNRT